MSKTKKSKPKKKPRPYPDKVLIKGALRRLMARSPIVYEVKEKAVHKKKKGPRGGKVYICKICKKTFAGKDVQVDHIIPVVPLDSCLQDMTYEEIVARIFCPKKNLQVVCKTCHKEKTKEERAERKKYKNG
jgi:5-methylcytosine-specific restriction endonuclease McrA